MPSPKPDATIVKNMDALAAELVQRASVTEEGKELDLMDKLAVFQTVTKWVQVKNRAEPEQEGSGLDDFKKRLASPDSEESDPRGRLRTGFQTGKASAAGLDKRWGAKRNPPPIEDEDAEEGPSLASIRATLPGGAPDLGYLANHSIDSGVSCPESNFGRKAVDRGGAGRGVLLGDPGDAKPQHRDPGSRDHI